MADIRFWCPHCGKKLGVDEKGAGLTISCPDCHKSLQIPSAEKCKSPSKALRPAGWSAEPVTLVITLPRFRWRTFLSDRAVLAGLSGLVAGTGFFFCGQLWAAALLLIVPLLSALKLSLRRSFVSGTALFLLAAIPLVLLLFRLAAPPTREPAPAVAAREEQKNIPPVAASLVEKKEEPVQPPMEQPAIPAIGEPGEEPKGDPVPALVPIEPRNVPVSPPMKAVTPVAPTPPAPKAAAVPEAGGRVQLPFVIYSECTDPFQPYCPSGWMGNILAIDQNDCWEENPHSGQTCIRVRYEARGKWAGVAWQDPPNNWGEMEGGYDITGASRLTFWARGQTGQETVEFKVGLLGIGKRIKDTTRKTTGKIGLSNRWKQYSIPLVGCNLQSMMTGFLWVLEGGVAPITFYLDDIQYE